MRSVPNTIDTVRAVSTSAGVEVSWTDEPPHGIYVIARRNLGSKDWIPLAYVRDTRGGLGYLDTLPRFGRSVEYWVQGGCEDEDSPTKVTLAQENDPWDVTDCSAWTTPIAEVTVTALYPTWDGVTITWNDTDEPPVGRYYRAYVRADGSHEWQHDSQWEKLRYFEDDPLELTMVLDEDLDPATLTFGITRGVVCDPETLDGATARAPEPPPTEPTTTAPEPPSPEPPRRPDPSDG